MAKVYQALADVSIPKPVAKLDPNKEDSDWITEGATYPAGSLISEDWMTPRDQKRAEAGEFSHVLQESDQEIPEGVVAGGVFDEPTVGVFIAEHEAERTALEAAGHIVVPDQQKMEVLSSSLPHQRAYQEAVKEQGADKRPILEHLQSERPRVPDEMLYGAETPSGTPHNRGPVEADGSPAMKEEADSEENGDSEGEAARPAPGSSESESEDKK